jgi:two-component system invasion response regulator UvrY
MSTVNTYRARILQKMNMKTDAELIRYAIQNQLID